MKCYELTQPELEGHSELSDLARECGYSSLRSCLNDHNMWGADVEVVKEFLRDQLKNSFTQYTVTIKTDPSYYGEGVDKTEAMELAKKIAAKLEEKFPGINIRMDNLIGHGRKDDTTGPEQSVCEEIDYCHQRAFETVVCGGAQ